MSLKASWCRPCLTRFRCRALRCPRLTSSVIRAGLLSRIVNGYRQPSAEFRKKISAILHSDEIWLFEPEDGVRPAQAIVPEAMES